MGCGAGGGGAAAGAAARRAGGSRCRRAPCALLLHVMHSWRLQRLLACQDTRSWPDIAGLNWCGRLAGWSGCARHGDGAQRPVGPSNLGLAASIARHSRASSTPKCSSDRPACKLLAPRHAKFRPCRAPRPPQPAAPPACFTPCPPLPPSSWGRGAGGRPRSPGRPAGGQHAAARWPPPPAAEAPPPLPCSCWRRPPCGSASASGMTRRSGTRRPP